MRAGIMSPAPEPPAKKAPAGPDQAPLWPDQLSAWFKQRFGTPTAIQQRAWPPIQSGQNVLISAPTGTGKSLAAWLPLVDRLRHCDRQAAGVSILYVSPLRALSCDMAAGLHAWLSDLPALEGRSGRTLRVGVRTGDTSRSERNQQSAQPPDILLTTPESLFILLSSDGGRRLLGDTRAVIIDEIHALIETKRGAHLALSLERLEGLCGPIQRIGLSATVNPLKDAGQFLCGTERPCRIVHDARPVRAHWFVESAISSDPRPIDGARWQAIYERLEALGSEDGKTLVFCNSRSLVERVGRRLSDRLGPDAVAIHHGSVGKDRRQAIERGLKNGALKLVVSTSSLELGIDIGPLTRVCQIGSPLAVDRLLQRAGRAGHQPGARGTVHLFPLHVSDLLDTQALLEAIAAGRIESHAVASRPLDVLAQHVVALCAAGEECPNRMFATVRQAAPWRDLERCEFDRVIDLLHHGYVFGRETGRGPIQRLAGHRLVADPLSGELTLLNAGAIPEWFEYDVVDQGGRLLGRLDEEFAFESAPGQVLQLGGQFWRIQRIRAGFVDVEPVAAEMANLPFWLGDGPGRSDVLSGHVGKLVSRADRGLSVGHASLDQFFEQSQRMLGALPHQQRIVFERFFDPAGDQHLVIHNLAGSRINRAWGLALRKRLCRSFNFELQAAATDNGILISLGAVHSFELGEVAGWLDSENLERVLIQALLDTPLFQTRLRWCAQIALAIPRRDRQGRVHAQIQRSQTDNLIARIFPDQLACLENLHGQRRVPDHPLVQQALRDCLEEHMDLPGLVKLYRGIEAGTIVLHSADHEHPSPLAQCLIHTARGSHLDPAEAEERRTRSFESATTFRAAGDAGPQRPVALSTGTALEKVLIEACYLTAEEGRRLGLEALFMRLTQRRAAYVVERAAARRLWVAAEHLALALAIWPRARLKPFVMQELRSSGVDRDEALLRALLGRVRWTGGCRIERIAEETGLPEACLVNAMERLRAEGSVHRVDWAGASLWQERRPGRKSPNAAGSACA